MSGKARLLAAFVDHLLRTGLNDVSLRPAANALGTNPRMLLYYFGSRDKLLLAALAKIRDQERMHFAREIQRRRLGGSIAAVLRASWRWYTAPEREPYLRLLVELYGLSIAKPGPFQGFADAMLEDYVALMREGLRSWGFSARESEVGATLYCATFRGLLMDVLTTGDRRRVGAAIAELGRNLERELLARQRPLQRRHPVPRSLSRPRRGGT